MRNESKYLIVTKVNNVLREGEDQTNIKRELNILSFTVYYGEMGFIK